MLFGIQENFKFIKMKKILLSVLTMSTLLFFACNRSSIDEPKFQLKTKPLSIETLKSISQELKDKGFVNNRNLNAENSSIKLNAKNSSIKTESNSNAEIIEILQPLIDNGRNLHTELISFVQNSQEWQAMTLVERNEIIHMSDEQLADLSLIYSGVKAQSIADAIHDCVGLALGVAGLRSIAMNLVSQPTVWATMEILKWVGKRYLGYIGVGIMLWDFADCMSHF
jgi:hypothetical protein